VYCIVNEQGKTLDEA
jgi:hypothetical protein